jgi:hypothetical protein
MYFAPVVSKYKRKKTDSKTKSNNRSDTYGEDGRDTAHRE